MFPPALNCRSASSFSMKAELLMKMCGVEYKAIYSSRTFKAPSGKLPFIKDGDELIADSHFIYKHICQKYDCDLDADLTPQQRAISLAFERLIEEHLVWTLVYSRWIDEDFNHVLLGLFKRVPWIRRKIVTHFAKRIAQKGLYYQGVGRHEKQKIYKLGCDDLDAISVQLGDNKYFFGNKVSAIDASIYAVLAATIYPNINSPLKQHAISIVNFKAYMKNIEEKFDYSPRI